MFIHFKCVSCNEKHKINATSDQYNKWIKDPDNYKKIFSFHTSEFHWFQQERCKTCLVQAQAMRA